MPAAEDYIDPEEMQRLEIKGQSLAVLIDSLLNKRNLATGSVERKYGFVVMLFPFHKHGLTYISNAERDDMVKALEELLDKWKRGDAGAPAADVFKSQQKEQGE
jgi:hypothetical protein